MQPNSQRYEKRQRNPKLTASPTQLRRAVEELTGTQQNMKLLGYKAVGFTLKGEPTRFVQIGNREEPYYFIQRTVARQWRIGYATGMTVSRHNGQRFMVNRKVDSPLFPGPIAAAMWLAVEKENGSIRITEG